MEIEQTTDAAPQVETVTPDTAMGDAYTRAMSMADDAPEPEADVATDGQARGPDGKFIAADQPETPDPAPEAEASDPESTEAAPTTEAPSHLPLSVREKWADIPEDVRPAISQAHQEMAAKLADSGRKMQGVQPIYDAVVKAARDIPEMQQMTPQQIANDVFAMANVQKELMRDPVGTIIKVAQDYGALEGLQAKMAGGDVPQSAETIQRLTQTISGLQKQIEAFGAGGIDQMIDTRLTTKSLEQEISAFQAKAEHFDAVEDVLPHFVTIAQQMLGEGHSNADYLQKAYDMAISAKGLKAPTVPTADPQRNQAAIKAKSANVPAATTGKPKPLTDNEAMGSAYDRLMAS